MEPVARLVKYPNEWELSDILKKYPGWITAIAEGTIENPEKYPTEHEILVERITAAADEMGVFKQEGMPNRRYVHGKYDYPDTDLLRAVYPLIAKKDDTSFGILNHLLIGGQNLKVEVENAIHCQQLLGISYKEAAYIVRSFAFYQEGVNGVSIPDPRDDPSTLNQHVAIQGIIKVILEALPNKSWQTHSKDWLSSNPAAWNNPMFKEEMTLNNPDLLTLAVEFPDEAERVCRKLAESGVFDNSEIHSAVTTAIESLRAGVPAALIEGSL